MTGFNPLKRSSCPLQLSQYHACRLPSGGSSTLYVAPSTSYSNTSSMPPPAMTRIGLPQPKEALAAGADRFLRRYGRGRYGSGTTDNPSLIGRERGPMALQSLGIDSILQYVNAIVDLWAYQKALLDKIQGQPESMPLFHFPVFYYIF
jgi:hypothetical protein